MMKKVAIVTATRQSKAIIIEELKRRNKVLPNSFVQGDITLAHVD